MMYGAQGGGSGTNVGSKFTPQSFGSTLMKSMTQKENAVSSSQAFPLGFGKYISDGGLNEKIDPHQLPLAMKDNGNNGKGFTSPGHLGFLGAKGGSSGAGSYKSGSNLGKNEYGGASSTDEVEH